MPRFPGFDPFIESQLWEDFHTHYIVELSHQLVSQLRGRFLARIGVRAYVERSIQPVFNSPDVDVLSPGSVGDFSNLMRPQAESTLVPPVLPEEMKEPFINILSRDSMQVVTVIELLSPGNKQRGADGHREYLRKRDHVLRSSADLVELDLLRGGQRVPMAAQLPAGDYYAISSPAPQRPLATVWSWTLPDPMPVISIPLENEDHASLDLQDAFDTLYEKADYEHQIDHSLPLRPRLSESQQPWLDAILASA